MDEYRSLVGMNYKNDNENEVRAEPGDKITDMPDNEARKQLRLKNIEEWVPRQTDNVPDNPDEGAVVTGVQSRHADGGETIVLKEVTK
jgi:hypothetical protein